jgi:hypothetical protein
MSAPDPLHWTQNSCFGAFRTVLLPHESRCQTGRTGAINAQVREMMLRRNFLRNERTRSTPLDPKLIFWVHFAPFHNCTKVGAKRDELVPLTHQFTKGITSEFFATNAPDPLHWTQNSCFGAFRTVSLLHESQCKTR